MAVHVAAGATRLARGVRKAGRGRGIQVDADGSSARTVRVPQGTDFRSSAGVSSAVSTLMERAKAIRASWIIGTFILPFYPIQLFFGLVQLAGFAGEYAGEQYLWGLGAVAIPGQTIFAAGYIMTLIFSCFAMFAAAFLYTVQGINWLRGFGFLSFVLCTVLCFVPVLNIFPWLVAWILIVVGAQKRR